MNVERQKKKKRRRIKIILKRIIKVEEEIYLASRPIILYSYSNKECGIGREIDINMSLQ